MLSTPMMDSATFLLGDYHPNIKNEYFVGFSLKLNA